MSDTLFSMQLLELVPRQIESLLNEAEQSITAFPQLDGFNIPDVRRLSVRSLDVVPHFLDNNWHIVPHIRSRDTSVVEHLALLRPLVERGLRHVLVVRGDEIKDGARSFGCSSLELIRAIREAFPGLIIYGALDPYRWEWSQEVDYAHEKVDAGVSGFFTQPVFDVVLAEKILKTFAKTDVFLGVAPVGSEKSKIYWETVNKVVFPDSFVFDLPGSAKVVRDIMACATSLDQHIYHMPIVIDPITYLKAVFSV